MKYFLILLTAIFWVSCSNGKNVKETANQTFPTKIYQTDSLKFEMKAPNMLSEIPLFDETHIEGKLLTMLFKSIFINKELQDTFRTDSVYCYQNNLSFQAIGYPESLFLSSEQSEILFYETKVTGDHFIIIRHMEE